MHMQSQRGEVHFGQLWERLGCVCRKQTRLNVKVESGIKNAANRGVWIHIRTNVDIGEGKRNPASATCDHIRNRDTEDRGGLQA